MTLSLKDMGAVITGGASGIGKAVAIELLKHGARVIIADVQTDLGRALEDAYPRQVKFVYCDVTNLDHYNQVATAAASLPNGAAIWFLNAGVSTENKEDLLTHSKGKVWKKMLDINLTAVIEGAQVAYDHFHTCNISGPKFIISTASIAGLLPMPSVVYATTKGAVIHFARSLALRLKMNGHDDILSYALCPSFTDTPLVRGDVLVDAGGEISRGDGSWDEGQKAFIQSTTGGLLSVEDMVKGFFGLLFEQPPNGAVLRVTLRQGKHVVHDLVNYGKESGGPLPPRPGVSLFGGDFAKLSKL